MSGINMASILSKAQKCMAGSKMQRKVDEITDGVFLGTLGSMKFAASNHGVRPKSAGEAASKFIEVLKREAESLGTNASGSFAGVAASGANGGLGATAIAAISNLDHGEPVKIGRNKYIIDVNFDGNLHRDSLDPSYYDGIDNIVALLNKGYSASATVYGVWLGHYGDMNIPSLRERTGAHFIESAIRDFMGNYAAEYGVIDIEVNDVYK